MARIVLPDGSGDERERLWALHPRFGEVVEPFSRVVQEASLLSVREQEGARIRVTELVGCSMCREARVEDPTTHDLDEEFYVAAAEGRVPGGATAREELAIEFAEHFVRGSSGLDEELWDRLRAHFDDVEILDLATCCSKWLGIGRINAVLELSTSCPLTVPVGNTR